MCLCLRVCLRLRLRVCLRLWLWLTRTATRVGAVPARLRAGAPRASRPGVSTRAVRSDCIVVRRRKNFFDGCSRQHADCCNKGAKRFKDNGTPGRLVDLVLRRRRAVASARGDISQTAESPSPGPSPWGRPIHRPRPGPRAPTPRPPGRPSPAPRHARGSVQTGGATAPCQGA